MLLTVYDLKASNSGMNVGITYFQFLRSISALRFWGRSHPGAIEGRENPVQVNAKPVSPELASSKICDSRI